MLKESHCETVSKDKGNGKEEPDGRTDGTGLGCRWAAIVRSYNYLLFSECSSSSPSARRCSAMWLRQQNPAINKRQIYAFPSVKSQQPLEVTQKCSTIHAVIGSTKCSSSPELSLGLLLLRLASFVCSSGGSTFFRTSGFIPQRREKVQISMVPSMGCSIVRTNCNNQPLRHAPSYSHFR